MNTVRVLDIPLFASNIRSAAVIVLESKDAVVRNFCISATGAHGLVYSRKNLAFRNILESFYLNLPDGMPGVWVGKIKGAKNMQRCYGPNFFRDVMLLSANTCLKHFLCGGKEGVANRLKSACETKFKNNNIVGTYCPPFETVEKYDYAGIASFVNSVKPDVVWIGLSTPKQEQFAFHLSKHTDVKFIICVGAAFDFHIGNVKQAPAWIQKAGMEWLFRLFTEPKRLWRRYFEVVPMFIYYNFAELFSGIFNKR
ncbi:MAG: WecB/TagA/CpsF family glycosyltransferase [Cyclobacteriaceae bacterium]